MNNPISVSLLLFRARKPLKALIREKKRELWIKKVESGDQNWKKVESGSLIPTFHFSPTDSIKKSWAILLILSKTSFCQMPKIKFDYLIFFFKNVFFRHNFFYFSFDTYKMNFIFLSLNKLYNLISIKILLAHLLI